MRQRSLAEEGFEKFRKPTRREKFLEEMDQVIPWSGVCKVIEPYYPKGKGAGRRSAWNGCSRFIKWGN